MNFENIISSIVDKTCERQVPPIKWFVSFPKSKSKNFYRTDTNDKSLIHAISAKQALGYWLTQDNERNVFKNYKDVIYQNRRYNESEGRVLYRKLEATNDWEAIPTNRSKASSVAEEILNDIDGNKDWDGPSGQCYCKKLKRNVSLDKDKNNKEVLDNCPECQPLVCIDKRKYDYVDTIAQNRSFGM